MRTNPSTKANLRKLRENQRQADTRRRQNVERARKQKQQLKERQQKRLAKYCTGKNCDKSCSFHGDTLVLSDAGMIPIRDIHPDDHRVWAKDEVTGETGWKPVLAHYSNAYSETVHVEVVDPNTGASQTILSNRIHPFFALPRAATSRLHLSGAMGSSILKQGAWIEAASLTSGMRLLASDGTLDEVASVNVSEAGLQAYNLTVVDFHTYFVAEDADDEPIWVHNDCPDPPGPNSNNWKKWLASQKYADASYHGKTVSGKKNPAPTDPRRGLANSFTINKNTDRRIGYDRKNKEIIAFDKTAPNTWHGHSRNWSELNQRQKNALIKAKIFNKRGKLIE